MNKLCAEIEKTIAETGYTFSRLSELGGAAVGNLSASLRGKSLRPVTIRQLDALTRVKVEVESLFGHIKGNRSFRRFSLRGLDKVHTEFGIVALAHNLLKVAGIRHTALLKKRQHKKVGRKTLRFSAQLFILGTYWTAPWQLISTKELT